MGSDPRPDDLWQHGASRSAVTATTSRWRRNDGIGSDGKSDGSCGSPRRDQTSHSPSRRWHDACQRQRRATRGTLKRILRYIRGTTTAELHLKLNADMSDDEVLAVTDASWASLADRRSTSGGTLWLGGMLIAHWSRTQPVVTQSSCEAELIALTSGATEAKLIQSVLEELGMKVKIRIQSDSSSAVMVTAKRGLGLLRHIQVRQLWLQEETRAGRITVEHVTGETNVADLLTKALPTARFYYLAELMGMEMKPSEDDNMIAPIEWFNGGMFPFDLEMWIAEVEDDDGNIMRQDGDEEEEIQPSIDAASVTPPKCLHCHYPMVLMITERGVATWRCGWCAAVRPWQAYHDTDLEAQQEIIEVFGAEEHYIGQDHDPMWMPDFQPTGWCGTVEAVSCSTSIPLLHYLRFNLLKALLLGARERRALRHRSRWTT